MLVNPSIYNNLGRFTSNYDLLTLQKKSGSTAYSSKPTGYPYKNSIADQINSKAFQQVSSFASTFKEDVKNINAFAQMMSNTKSPIYNARTAVQNSTAFNITAKDGAKIGKQTFKATQLATSQKNTSAARPQNEVLSANLDGDLKITQNGKSQTFNLSLKAGETVGDGYLRIADTINKEQTGVKAEVKTDENGYSKLSLTATETGKGNAFEVSGTFADALNLKDNQEDAQNMTYELNGVQGESETNQLSVDKGNLIIDAKKVSTETETFEVKTSNSGLVNTLKDFASAFNKFVDDNADNTNPMTKAIVKQMSNSVRKSFDKLKIEGLSITNEGKINIDETKLTKGLEGKVDQVKESLSKFDSFASDLTRKTEQVLKMPLYNVSPDFTNNSAPVNPYIYNYNAQYALNNISQMTNPGYIMDVRI